SLNDMPIEIKMPGQILVSSSITNEQESDRTDIPLHLHPPKSDPAMPYSVPVLQPDDPLFLQLLIHVKQEFLSLPRQPNHIVDNGASREHQIRAEYAHPHTIDQDSQCR